jgi:hypothetical protein
MMKKNFLIPITLMMVMMVLIILTFTFPASSAGGSATMNWSRNLEPVVLNGSQLSQFSGVGVSHLFAYSFRGGNWEQIPLQIDEINSIGDYGYENGLLDGDDEVVFMAMDLGEAVGESEWIEDLTSRSHSRAQIKVTNPLTPTEVGYVYLYQSSALTPVHDDYVDWDDTLKMITSGSYKAGLAFPFQGLEILELYGNPVDVLDRSKFRFSGACRNSGVEIPFSYTEELPEEIMDLIVLEPDIDGPVRVGGGSSGRKNWSYHSMRENQYGIDFDALSEVVCFLPFQNFGHFSSFRVSNDWLNPVDSGMGPMSYFDSNTGAGLPVDGMIDDVPISPVNAWSQVSGSYGSVVRITDISENIIGTVENYYKDNSATDNSDTGDQQSFGDAGFKVVFNPPQPEYGQLEVEAAEFYLAPLQPNLGFTYEGYLDNPLQINISSQDYSSVLYLPLVIKGGP